MKAFAPGFEPPVLFYMKTPRGVLAACGVHEASSSDSSQTQCFMRVPARVAVVCVLPDGFKEFLAVRGVHEPSCTTLSQDSALHEGACKDRIISTYGIHSAQHLLLLKEECLLRVAVKFMGPHGIRCLKTEYPRRVPARILAALFSTWRTSASTRRPKLWFTPLCLVVVDRFIYHAF